MYKPIIKLLESYGHQAYVSGETARDLYRGVKPIENHVSVNAEFITLRDNLKDKIISIDTYSSTITIKYKEEYFTIHPLRTIYLNNTYCNYKFTSSFEENANHIGFTINALYYNPLNDSWLNLHNAKQDIDNKIIRFVGEAEDRILESKIRLLQAPVLASILGEDWVISAESHEAIKKYNLKIVMAHTSQIHKEMRKMFKHSQTPSKFFSILRSTKLIDNILPELTVGASILQSNKQKNLTLYQHIMYAMDSVKLDQPNYYIIRLAALLHDIAKPHCYIETESGVHFYSHENVGAILAERILYRWGFNKTTSNKVSLLVKNHLFNAGPRVTEASIKKLIARIGPENIHDLLDLRIADRWGTGRKDIKMTHVERMRTKVNKYLAKTSPNKFKLSLSEKDISKAIRFATDDKKATVRNVKQYLEHKVLYGRLSNKPSNLKRAIREVNKLPCPLDKPHLFKTWASILQGTEDSFDNGTLKCGVYCDFICDKKRGKK